MGLIKTEQEQQHMKAAGKILASVLRELESMIAPGITTLDLDQHAEKRIREQNASPAFKGYMGFPGTLCTSVNDEVVHTFPSDRVLKDGDIISVDCGVIFNQYHADSAFTAIVGKSSPSTQKFLSTAHQALSAGIDAAISGNFVGDISEAIENVINSENYSVIKDLTGHGIGKSLHEEPHVPNFRESSKGIQLKPGMTLAIEPIFAMGNGEIYTAKDGWNILTKDQSLAIQVEHTILITQQGPEILTQR